MWNSAHLLQYFTAYFKHLTNSSYEKWKAASDDTSYEEILKLELISESHVSDCIKSTFEKSEFPWCRLKSLLWVFLATLMADFLAVYKDVKIFLPNMHLWQCDVPEDRSPRHWGMNDIKRPGIQPQPIHMQMASLALTLINSL